MITEPLLIPAGAGVSIRTEVQRYGRTGLETGGFLLAAESAPREVAVVAFAGRKGVERGWGFFRISGLAIDGLFEWAETHALRIPAQFHSHMYEAFLSPTDQRDGFNVRDFISGVVPSFAQPDADPRVWGWWSFDGRKWIGRPAPMVTSGDASVVYFDEDGVTADA